MSVIEIHSDAPTPTSGAPVGGARPRGSASARLFAGLMRALELLLIAIFAVMVADVLWQVFSRYVVGQSSSFTEELARFALIWLTVLGAAYLNGRREHLTMDFLTRKLAPAARARRERRVEWWMFGFAGVVMVVGGGYLVYTISRLGQVSPAMGVPLGVVYAVVPVSGLLVMFFSFYHAVLARPERAAAPRNEINAAE